MPPKFIFVRHGEATHNVAFHEFGDSVFTNKDYEDAPLTEQGKIQARKTGEDLASLDIIDIWSSPLTRCIETGEEIFEESSAQNCYVHDNLLEQLGGGNVCNNRLSKHVLKKKFRIWNTDSIPDLPAAWINQETLYTCRQRMWMFVILLADLYKKHNEDKYVLIVSHGHAIHALTGKSLKNAEHVILTLKELMD